MAKLPQIILDNFSEQTFNNLKDTCNGTFLFLTEDGQSFQLKGTFTHYSSGEFFEDMKKWNPKDLPGVGVAVLAVTEIYSSAKKITFYQPFFC